MRKPLIAANWKMHLGMTEAVELALAVCNGYSDYSKADVALAPSFTNIAAVASAVKSTNKPVTVAAQNVYTEANGAFTGEVSVPMIISAGAGAVILGHSERRNIFLESDEIINSKVHKALEAGLTVVLCVGELLREREANVAFEVVLAQLGKSLAGVTDLNKVVIAYEPVWAIGTGKTATPEDAQAMHAMIRSFLSRVYNNSVAESVRILYGGSVKPDNITDLMKKNDIDGALVGGASLKADSFLKIVNY